MFEKLVTHMMKTHSSIVVVPVVNISTCTAYIIYLASSTQIQSKNMFSQQNLRTRHVVEKRCRNLKISLIGVYAKKIDTSFKISPRP